MPLLSLIHRRRTQTISPRAMCTDFSEDEKTTSSFSPGRPSGGEGRHGSDCSCQQHQSLRGGYLSGLAESFFIRWGDNEVVTAVPPAPEHRKHPLLCLAHCRWESKSPGKTPFSVVFEKQSRFIFLSVSCLVLVYRTYMRNVMCEDKRKD